MLNLTLNNTNIEFVDDLLSEDAVLDYRKKSKTLYESVCCCENNSHNVFLNLELSNEISYKIASELALAIDKNNVSKVNELKQKYANLKEFIMAKDFLNKKCKEIWNIYDKDFNQAKVPTLAMKALGISNCPNLEDMLDNALKYYEKDNGTITIDIIQSILKNKKLNYDIIDICKYLENAYRYKKYKCNFKTIEYIAQKTNFEFMKLARIGVTKEEFKKLLKKQSLKTQIVFYTNLLFRIYLHT